MFFSLIFYLQPWPCISCQTQIYIHQGYISTWMSIKLQLKLQMHKIDFQVPSQTCYSFSAPVTDQDPRGPNQDRLPHPTATLPYPLPASFM